MIREDLEDRARDPEASFRRLIWIGCGADGQPLALDERDVSIRSLPERFPKHIRRVFLDEDAPLEREPGNHLPKIARHLDAIGIARRGTFEGIAVRISCVAVRASQ